MLLARGYRSAAALPAHSIDARRQNKSKAIRDMLGMRQFSPEWTLPGRIADNPLIWMLKVNGMIVDARSMPLEVQQIAFEQGLIPYVPGLKDL
ncbi:MAG: hypothetical protein EPN21_17300 [Methylococcaceae bacterium]|nr:MAG: hypothetical protein EPN21_17300 [Methylococcaceae bacterium]